MGSILVNGINRLLNLKQDERDPQDHLRLIQSPGDVAALPSFATTEAMLIPAYDQGNAGTCAGQSERRLIESLLRKRGTPREVSALFPYWNARPDPYTDSGVGIRDIVKAGAKSGLCREETWPYDVTNVCVKPPDIAFVEANLSQVLKYTRSQTINEVRAVLSRGNPVIFGTAVYPSFESCANGLVPMPTEAEVNNGPLGYHALTWGEYSIFDPEHPNVNTLSGVNSWGPSWGRKGRFTMTADYVAAYCTDWWDSTEMESGEEVPCEEDWLHRFWHWL